MGGGGASDIYHNVCQTGCASSGGGDARHHVRFAPESGRVQRNRRCLLWAKSGHARVLGGRFSGVENDYNDIHAEPRYLRLYGRYLGQRLVGIGLRIEETREHGRILSGPHYYFLIVPADLYLRAGQRAGRNTRGLADFV
jgi:hypothetical protein